MVDVVIVILIGLVLFRGWARGFVREAMDLVGLVVGTLLAFRIAPAVGAVISSMAGISTDTGSVIGGLIVFFGVGIGAAFAAAAIERRFHMPGLSLVNRAGGAGLAAAWGVFLTTLILTLAVVLPMPQAVASRLDDSSITRTLTDPGGMPQEMFARLAGNRIVSTIINLREALGTRRVIIEPGQLVALPGAQAGEIEADPQDAATIFDLLNRARVDAGLDPLAWSDALAAVGESHATEMYLDGYFAHESPKTGDVGDRLADAGITYRYAGENLALAATPDEIHNGLMESPGHRANIMGADYRRVGVAVVSGPLGLMTVQVFTG
jgi:uncharacterized protein YkwD/uncharacterized membrane protein required for colicin V production